MHLLVYTLTLSLQFSSLSEVLTAAQHYVFKLQIMGRGDLLLRSQLCDRRVPILESVSTEDRQMGLVHDKSVVMGQIASPWCGPAVCGGGASSGVHSCLFKTRHV
ncbi:hypothetical protein AVEN_122039-1 [Araneus ventricosus]|uniref:Secreted protein n=1 Tax=Araneus ventricosus TaxID=182803 RepID=A0A4Y2F3K1_ARAVE|nr:hypothetical protein AVEN_122039-1 [Araneus ventricosus]